MSTPHLPSSIAQQTLGRRHLPVLPQPQPQTYFTGRHTQGQIPQDASTNSSSWNHYAELATTTYRWARILWTEPGHNDGNDAPNVTAESVGRSDEHGAPHVPTEPLRQHNDSGAPDVPDTLTVNGVVYHKSPHGYSGGERR